MRGTPKQGESLCLYSFERSVVVPASFSFRFSQFPAPPNQWTLPAVHHPTLPAPKVLYTHCYLPPTPRYPGTHPEHYNTLPDTAAPAKRFTFLFAFPTRLQPSATLIRPASTTAVQLESLEVNTPQTSAHLPPRIATSDLRISPFQSLRFASPTRLDCPTTNQT